MEKGTIFPEGLEAILIERALGCRAAEKVQRGYLSKKELVAITGAMLELSNHFNGLSGKALDGYMRSRWHRAAYFLYYLPANVMKARAVFSELSDLSDTFAGRDSLFVLDVGSGPGSMSLAALDFAARETQIRKITFTALDSSSEALDDYRFFIKHFAKALAEKGPILIEAIRRLRATPEFAGRLFYAYTSASSQPEYKALVQALME